MSHRLERSAFLLLTLGALAYVILRAVRVPITHDETTSFLMYSQPGTFLPFRSMWDANNHFLNSACGWLGYSVAGLHLLALRWSSVLAFPLFAWAAWRIGIRIAHPAVRWCLWCTLLLCPLVIEFFSMFRGYAPALGFLFLAVEAMMRYAVAFTRSSLAWALVALILANGFVLAFVPLWTVALTLLVVLGKGQRRHWVLLLFGGLLPWSLAVGYSFLLARFGLLYQGGTEGFIEVTVRSLARRVFGADDPMLIWAMLLIVLGSIAMLARRAVLERSISSPGVLVASLLILEGVGRIATAHAIGLNHAEDRTAMHLLVLGILAVAFAADSVAIRWLQCCYALLLLPLPLRMLSTANLQSTTLFPEQSMPSRFIAFAENMEQELGRPVVVATHRHAGHPWALQRRMNGGEGDANAHSWPNGLSDALITTAANRGVASADYMVVDSAPANLILLLVREPRLSTALVSDTTYHIHCNGEEQSAPIHLPARLLQEHDLFVELRGAITSEANPLDVRLCIAVLDSAGNQLHNDLVFLSTRREAWHGEDWRTIRHIPRNPDAYEAFLLFWEPAGQPYTVSEGRVIVRTAGP
ncbi:MAG: hypothetical protein IPM46_08205 [Flavobacteriales bacterium]|nr:hypothetical protein [Flavobacteriales bacterium]